MGGVAKPEVVARDLESTNLQQVKKNRRKRKHTSRRSESRNRGYQFLCPSVVIYDNRFSAQVSLGQRNGTGCDLEMRGGL